MSQRHERINMSLRFIYTSCYTVALSPCKVTSDHREVATLHMSIMYMCMRQSSDPGVELPPHAPSLWWQLFSRQFEDK